MSQLLPAAVVLGDLFFLPIRGYEVYRALVQAGPAGVFSPNKGL